VKIAPSEAISRKSVRSGSGASRLGIAATTKNTAPTRVTWNSSASGVSVRLSSRVIRWNAVFDAASSSASPTPAGFSAVPGRTISSTPAKPSPANSQPARLTRSPSSGAASAITAKGAKYMMAMVSPTGSNRSA